MFPNPVQGNTVFFSTDKQGTVQIYNILGKLIKTKTISIDNNKIDISSLSKGIYLVKINLENQMITKKLVKH